MGLMEKSIRWISVVTLLGLLPTRIVAARCGVAYPPFLNGVLSVLIAAAVGYVTNWIAIEMLFKPYEKNKWHLFSILTCGYWQQGLVPRNKDEIGVQLGKQTEKRLLDPEKIAAEFCGLIPEMLRDKSLQQQITDGVKTLVYNYRAPIANKIIDGIQRRSPEIIDMARSELGKMIRQNIAQRAIIGAFADEIADVAVACVNWDDVEQRLRCKVGEASSSKLIQDELDRLLASCTAWMETELVPTLEPKLLALAQGPIKDKIVEKLNLADRVAKAVAQQDVREFHAMINDLAAKHLGAVQILGYFLGAAVGLVQLVG